MAIRFYDASQFADNPKLTDAGIPRRYVSYMKDWFPEGQPQDRVYPDHVKQTAENIRKQGHYNICIDIEYLPKAPETQVWQMQSENTRPTTIALWEELIECFRDGFGEGARVGMYGNLPNWMDYLQFRDTRGEENPGTIQKQMFFQQWGQDIAPLVAKMDTVFPSFYGAFDVFSTGGLYGGRYDYITYTRWWAESIGLVGETVDELYQDELAMEAFFTDNKRGVMYPRDCIVDTLWILNRYNAAVCMWNSPSYMPKWDDYTIGQMVRFHE